MKKILVFLAGLLLAWNATAQFDNYFRNLTKEQKRAMGITVADTLLIWPDGTHPLYARQQAGFPDSVLSGNNDGRELYAQRLQRKPAGQESFPGAGGPVQQ